MRLSLGAVLACLCVVLASCACGGCRRGRQSSAAGATAASAPLCNDTIGLLAPLALCTPADPCSNLKGDTITTPTPVPKCMSRGGTGSTGSMGSMRWQDPASGAERMACVVEAKSGPAPDQPSTGKRPLLIFLHGSGGTADGLDDLTKLHEHAPSWIMAAIQGRNTHWPAKALEGSHFDFYFRDLGSPSKNHDVRAIDHVIDTLVAERPVDEARIYITGWSNGATFSNLYAIARHETATPGGHRIAAAAVFAGADPFRNLSAGDGCALATYPRSEVPLLQVHRSCDALVACDAAQREKFHLPPGDSTREWMETYSTRVGHGPPAELLLDMRGNDVSSCAPPADCSSVRGLAEHLKWPVEAEARMIAFLEAHPLVR